MSIKYYRPDIDGLRALAVIPVLIFHFFPNILPGGFVGVDVIGQAADAIDVNLDAPECVEPGTYIHVLLKYPVGTATASQILRGSVFINGYFE